MTRRKKITIKQAEKFSKDVQEYLNSIGAKETEDPLGYGTHVETTLGTLRIIVPTPESNSRSEIATIFARFEEPKRAAKGLGINSCNPHSGKWNFHEYSTEECLRVFMANVKRILPTEEVANA